MTGVPLFLLFCGVVKRALPSELIERIKDAESAAFDDMGDDPFQVVEVDIEEEDKGTERPGVTAIEEAEEEPEILDTDV